MIFERTAAYVLAVAGILQTLLPPWAIKPHCWRSIDVQIGQLHMQATNESNSAAGTPLRHSFQKASKGLQICVNDSDCITAWLDEASHGWMISKDVSGKSASCD